MVNTNTNKPQWLVMAARGRQLPVETVRILAKSNANAWSIA